MIRLPTIMCPTRIAALLMCGLPLVCTTTASAASRCTPQQRAHLAAARAVIANVADSAGPAASAARGVVARARRACDDAQPAHAIAVAARRFPAPRDGHRVRVIGVDVRARDGVWGIDIELAARRVASAPSERGARRARQLLLANATTVRGITWNADPTSHRFDARDQAAAADALARASRAADRSLARRTLDTVAVAARTRTVIRLPVLDRLLAITQLASAQRRVGALPATASRMRVLIAHAHHLIVASEQRSWSRMGGVWSTLAQHRLLVTRGAAFVRVAPDARTARVVAALRRDLLTRCVVNVTQLPSGVFYPWPADGTLDTQSATVDIDRPATVQLLIYAATGAAPVATITVAVNPGQQQLTWNGITLAGAAAAPGDFTYVIATTSRAGIAGRTPGLGAFHVRRDTTPPRIDSVRAFHRIAGGHHQVTVTWALTEPLSPRVSTRLVLTRGAHSATIGLGANLLRGTARRVVTLARGRWRATFVAIDGSGNRTTRPLQDIIIR